MASIFKRGGKKNRDGCYYIAYYERPGLRRTVRGCADLRATEALSRKLEADAMLRREGVIDPKAEKLSRSEAQPLAEQLEAFAATMTGKGAAPKHVSSTVSYIRTMSEACGFSKPADLDAAKVSAHVVDLKRQGKSARAINARLTALKSFARWLFRTERMRTDPMMQVGKLNSKADRRHQRRALGDDELARLIRAAEQGPEVLGMNGPERAMLYYMAIETGLRASELGSLTPESFDLADLNRSTVEVGAAYSKHRRDDIIPIRRGLAEAVTAFNKGRPSTAKLFNMPQKPACMLRRDLEAAKIAYRDESGRVVDFHALRHTFITRLARAGVPPAVAKSLARHSTITLTMDHYTHMLIGDQRAALDRLPGITLAEPERESATATGTYDIHPSEARSACAARRTPDTPRPVITGQHSRLDKRGADSTGSPLIVGTCQHVARPDNSQAPLAQLAEQLTLNQRVPGSSPGRRSEL